MLVVIGIISLLVAILLPAVNAARQAARRTECIHHLQQLDLAFQEHHAAFNRFPSAGWNWFDPPTFLNGTAISGAQQKSGWGFQILPFIENASVVSAGPVAVIRYADPLFFCPARRGPQTVVGNNNYRPPLPGGDLVERALCDYAGSNRDGTGILRRFDPTRAKDVRDGLSKTLLLGDKRMNLFNLGKAQSDDNEGYTVGWNADTLRRTQRPPLADFNRNAIDDSDQRIEDGDERFGSSHPGGFNAALGDGSVQAVSYEVDRAVWRMLGDRQDGLAFDMSQL